MKLGVVQQQPNERLSYTINYEEALTAGDDITLVTATVSPDGELDIDRVDIFAARTRIWVSGGVDRRRYKITVLAETSEGRKFEDELTFIIRDS